VWLRLGQEQDATAEFDYMYDHTSDWESDGEEERREALKYRAIDWSHVQ
jgi:hypothetical protein